MLLLIINNDVHIGMGMKSKYLNIRIYGFDFMRLKVFFNIL